MTYVRSLGTIRNWAFILPLMLVLAACGGTEDPTAEQQASSSTAAVESDTTGTVERLNINTATREQLLAIPNVGDRMVGEFFEYRPYVSIQQFRQEIGKYVSEEQVAAYEQYVYVPADPNESDAATLQQLPGVDETAANELIDGRPYASNEAFLDALSAHVSEDELATAETYLTTQ